MNLTVHDVLAANQLLVSLGAEDQMPRLAMTAIERSLELQKRLDRALDYAAHTPPNSAHARQMARILDGSITVDDELNEVQEHDRPMRESHAMESPSALPLSPLPGTLRETRKAPKKISKGKLKPGNGLAGRSTRERLEIREWIAENGFNIAPSGRIPQKYLDAFDQFQEQMRMKRRNGEQELPLSG